MFILFIRLWNCSRRRIYIAGSLGFNDINRFHHSAEVWNNHLVATSSDTLSQHKTSSNAASMSNDASLAPLHIKAYCVADNHTSACGYLRGSAKPHAAPHAVSVIRDSHSDTSIVLN